jgi:hypothetical protein
MSVQTASRRSPEGKTSREKSKFAGKRGARKPKALMSPELEASGIVFAGHSGQLAMFLYRQLVRESDSQIQMLDKIRN